MPTAPSHPSQTKPIVVLLGGPGSGKGTHGQALAAALGYQHLSSGEHFRDHIRRETPLGRHAQTFIERGNLVPDDVAGDLALAMLGGYPDAHGFVLDGYPRSLAQAKDLETMVLSLGCTVSQTLYLAVSDDEIVRRLSGRLTCRACGRTCHEAFAPPSRPGVCDACGGELFRRTDDAPETIRQRLVVFARMIGPLLDFYRKTGRLVEIAAEGPAHEVTARVIGKSLQTQKGRTRPG
jgi:adenylate kinase